LNNNEEIIIISVALFEMMRTPRKILLNPNDYDLKHNNAEIMIIK